MLSRLHKNQPLPPFSEGSSLPFSHTPTLNKTSSGYGHPFWLLSTHPASRGHGRPPPTSPWPSNPRRRQHSFKDCTEGVMMCMTFVTAVSLLQRSLRDWGFMFPDLRPSSLDHWYILPSNSATRNGTNISSSDGQERHDTYFTRARAI